MLILFMHLMFACLMIISWCREFCVCPTLEHSALEVWKAVYKLYGMAQGYGITLPHLDQFSWCLHGYGQHGITLILVPLSCGFIYVSGPLGYGRMPYVHVNGIGHINM